MYPYRQGGITLDNSSRSKSSKEAKSSFSQSSFPVGIFVKNIYELGRYQHSMALIKTDLGYFKEIKTM